MCPPVVVAALNDPGLVFVTESGQRPTVFVYVVNESNAILLEKLVKSHCKGIESFEEDRLAGTWRPWFNIDSER